MVIDALNKYRIILASRSPRRQQLLKELGLRFDIVVREYDETYPATLKGEEIASWLSRVKADSFLNEIAEEDIIITADTIVWCRDQVLGKPENADAARRMLQKLSGVTHQVITGVTILDYQKSTTFTDKTRVTFEAMDDDEIDYYVNNYEPWDKAGAYGIQEWIGLAACSRIEGSYFNVVGLPVQRLYKELQKFIKK